MNELEIFAFLKSRGLSNFAVCGIMGNLKQESNLNPKNLQNTANKKLEITDEEYCNKINDDLSKKTSSFIHDGCGFGLAQWTFWSRKYSLFLYTQVCKSKIDDLETQLEFLVSELYSYSLFDSLNKCGSLKSATELILKKYEKPKDQSNNALQIRLKYAGEYYNKFVPDFDVALDVLKGVWGNNPQRKKNILKSGYDYNNIQKLVNELVKEEKEDGIIKRSVDRIRKSKD